MWKCFYHMQEQAMYLYYSCLYMSLWRVTGNIWSNMNVLYHISDSNRFWKYVKMFFYYLFLFIWFMWSSAIHPSIRKNGSSRIRPPAPPSQLGFPHISRDKPLLMSTSRVKNRKPFKYKQQQKSFKRILPFFHSNHNHYLYFSWPVFL